VFTATQYPADYGFIEDTLGEAGDPLDVLVLVRKPTVRSIPPRFPSSLAQTRSFLPPIRE
jgi:inorganic pyrophosphatase